MHLATKFQSTWSKLLKLLGETDKLTILLEDVKIPFSIIDRTSRQKILNNTSTLPTNSTKLTFAEHFTQQYPAEYTFLSSANETVAIEQVSINQVLQSMVADHNGIKLRINDTRISRGSTRIWKLNNTRLIAHGSKEKPKGKLESSIKGMKMKTIKICRVPLCRTLSDICSFNAYI